MEIESLRITERRSHCFFLDRVSDPDVVIDIFNLDRQPFPISLVLVHLHDRVP